MTLIDWNRSGTPLVEIVTGPDFHSHEEVVDFLKELQRLIKWNNI
jgi:aspartyl-tRNA(Asn)/glutamyl-tRNA(Gln) amidotransferase subunit B